MPEFYTLKELIRYVAQRFENEIAFVMPRKGGREEEITFRAFAQDIAALGTALFALGLRGCNVALLGGNSYEWIVSYFAVANGGNAVVPLDRDLSAEDLVPLIEASGCAALIYAPDYADMLPCLQSAAGERRYICMDDIAALLAQGRQLVEGGDSAFADYPLPPDSLAAVVYTSGTTGKAKGVMLTHRNIASNASAGCRMVSGAGRVVLALPLHHTFGLLVGLIVPLLYCGKTYISRSVRNVQKDMVSLRATVAILVPAIVEVVHKKMWEAAERDGRAKKLRSGLRLSRFLMKLGIDVRRKLFKEVLDKLGGELYLMVCGGAPLSKQIIDDFYYMGIEFLNGYGITECSPVVSVNPVRGNKIGSVGLPLDCNRVRIEAGEIQVKGDSVMAGYYGDAAATREVFTGDGWFKTGDLGYLDKKGYLYVTGRSKNLIVLSNGKNVSPEELEEKIKRIPGVLETAVYAQGGKIAAEIYAEPDGEAGIRSAVHEMNRGLPKYKQIGRILFRDTEFPKTTTMKIKKHTIEEAGTHA